MFVLISDEEGNVIENEEGQVLIKNVNDGSMSYVSREMLQFDYGDTQENQGNQSNCYESDARPDLQNVTRQPLQSLPLNPPENDATAHLEPDVRNHYWNRGQILQLIESFKRNKHLLDINTVRNDTVWRKIANEIGHHTALECQNKFKYLKQRYTKKKDNMSIKATGAKAIHFEYFEEFDSIFRKDPNIVPVAIASSSRSYTHPSDIPQPEPEAQPELQLEPQPEHQPEHHPEPEPEPQPRIATRPGQQQKERKLSLARAISDFEKNAAVREAKRQKRHEEVIGSLNRFSNLLQTLIER